LRKRLASTVGPIEREEPLAGREAEVARIAAQMDATATGSPELVVIEGEPGIGKSFLANHIVGLARQRKWQVFSGRSEITRRSHAYTPWRAVFRSLLFQGKPPTHARLRKLLQE